MALMVCYAVVAKKAGLELLYVLDINGNRKEVQRE